MLVTSKTDAARWAMFLFLQEHGIKLARSEDFHAIGRVERGSLTAVVGYNAFSGNTCSMHVAGVGNWLSRELLSAAFHYPFVQAKLVQVFVQTSANNAKALRLEKHLGFTEFARVKDGWETGVDMLVLTMRKQDCRWLEASNELKAA
jgi:RimJ/RimL family protein N-acetyltransferase